MWFRSWLYKPDSVCICIIDKRINQSRVIDSSTHFFHSLTNEQSRQNWETYGNPDGPGGEWSYPKSHSMHLHFYVLTYRLLSMPVTQPLLVVNVLNNGRWNMAAHSFQWELTPGAYDEKESPTSAHTSAVGVHNAWSPGAKNNMFMQILVASKNGLCGLNLRN